MSISPPLSFSVSNSPTIEPIRAWGTGGIVIRLVGAASPLASLIPSYNQRVQLVYLLFKLRRLRLARPRQCDGAIGDDPARFRRHEQHAIAHEHGLFNTMRHQNDGVGHDLLGEPDVEQLFAQVR